MFVFIHFSYAKPKGWFNYVVIRSNRFRLEECYTVNVTQLQPQCVDIASVIIVIASGGRQKLNTADQSAKLT